MFSFISKAKKAINQTLEITQEVCSGLWQITYFSTAPDVDPKTLIGKRLVFFENGSVVSPDEGQKQLGTWRYDPRNKELVLRILGSWPTFLLTNTWQLGMAEENQLGLFASKSDQFLELHLERAA